MPPDFRPDYQMVIRLEPSRTAPALARRAIRAFANEWVVAADVMEAAELLTSELVTNAVTHGSGPVTLALARVDCSLAVTVGDSGSALPTVLPDQVDALGGRGLRLVELMSGAWGVCPHKSDRGKDIWFRVP